MVFIYAVASIKNEAFLSTHIQHILHLIFRFPNQIIIND